jgi:hypothetical protein
MTVLPADVKHALLKGLGQPALDVCVKTHSFIEWNDVNITDSCKRNSGVLKTMLGLVPDRVPRTSELSPGIAALDDEYQRKLSGAKRKKQQKEWSMLHGEKVRAMLAHVRGLRRRGVGSKSEIIQELKALVMLRPSSSAEMSPEDEPALDAGTAGAGTADIGAGEVDPGAGTAGEVDAGAGTAGSRATSSSHGASGPSQGGSSASVDACAAGIMVGVGKGTGNKRMKLAAPELPKGGGPP